MIGWHLNHKEFGNKPWTVQTEALRRAEGRPAFAWFLEMGLGKTSLSLNMFVEHFNNDAVDVMLVVCPYSFTGDWASTPKEWGVPHVHGEVWSKKTPVDEPGDSVRPRVVSVGFETVKTSARRWARELCATQRVMLVVDESLSLANPNSQLTSFVLDISKDCRFVYILNGTPIGNNVMDLWGQLKVVKALDGTNPYAFRNKFAKMGGYMGKVVKGIRNEDKLGALLDGCSFRALKSEWRKELPPKVHRDVLLDMTPKQRAHYDEMLRDFFTELGNIGAEASMVLTQMDKLRQISSGLVMQSGEGDWIENPKNNPKVRALDDLIPGMPGKFVVVHYYRKSGDMLIEHLNNQNLQPAWIKGQMSPTELANQKDRFNNDPACRAIVCQQAASFRGHTIIGGKGKDRASVMVFFENSFSYYERSQIEDRIHRGAQDTTCQYVNLVTSPIDVHVLKAIREKASTAELVDEFVRQARAYILNKRGTANVG